MIIINLSIAFMDGWMDGGVKSICIQLLRVIIVVRDRRGVDGFGRHGDQTECTIKHN